MVLNTKMPKELTRDCRSCRHFAAYDVDDSVRGQGEDARILCEKYGLSFSRRAVACKHFLPK